MDSDERDHTRSSFSAKNLLRGLKKGLDATQQLVKQVVTEVTSQGHQQHPSSRALHDESRYEEPSARSTAGPSVYVVHYSVHFDSQFDYERGFRRTVKGFKYDPNTAIFFIDRGETTCGGIKFCDIVNNFSLPLLKGVGAYHFRVKVAVPVGDGTAVYAWKDMLDPDSPVPVQKDGVVWLRVLAMPPGVSHKMIVSKSRPNQNVISKRVQQSHADTDSAPKPSREDLQKLRVNDTQQKISQAVAQHETRLAQEVQIVSFPSFFKESFQDSKLS
jgi:hypothetical protein